MQEEASGSASTDKGNINVEDDLPPLARDLTDSQSVVDTATTEKRKSSDSVQALNVYQIKPLLVDKFKGNQIKEIIQAVLSENLLGKSYDANNAKRWTVNIANVISERVKDLQMKRYKHIVQVTIGEMKGAGVKSGVRCLWDAETDGYTSETFINDSIFSFVVVFGIYLY